MDPKPGPDGLNVYEVYLSGASRRSTTTYAVDPEEAREKVAEAVENAGDVDAEIDRVTQWYEEIDDSGQRLEEERPV